MKRNTRKIQPVVTKQGSRIKPGGGELSRRAFLAGTGTLAGASLLGFNIVGRAKAAVSGQVTIYSSMPSRYLTKMADAYNQLKTGVTLEPFYAPTYQAYERLRAELQASRLGADLFLVADPGPFLELKNLGALLHYESDVYDHYSSKFKDADFTWINGRSIATIFAYNHDMLSANEAPSNWEEFVDPKWAGKQGIIDMRVGGTAYNWYYTTRQVIGVDWWRRLAKNKPQLHRGHGALMDKMVSSQVPITEQLDYYVFTNVRDKKAPVTAVYPTEVIPVTMAPLAILKDGPNVEGAKAVFDWWLSKDGQSKLQDINGIYSVRDDVEPLSGKPPFESLKTIEIDLADYSKSREKLQKEYIKIFGL